MVNLHRKWIVPLQAWIFATTITGQYSKNWWVISFTRHKTKENWAETQEWGSMLASMACSAISTKTRAIFQWWLRKLQIASWENSLSLTLCQIIATRPSHLALALTGASNALTSNPSKARVLQRSVAVTTDLLRNTQTAQWWLQCIRRPKTS